ncbi:MAG TPA: hypothetical protein VHB01_03905 [Nitrosospira sp.]|nr:hypothetical protein [Nitrosospira sp.]
MHMNIIPFEGLAESFGHAVEPGNLGAYKLVPQNTKKELQVIL